MKKVLLYSGLIITILVLGSIFTIHLWIGKSVKENIGLAQEKYHGTPEDALIAFLQDENNSVSDRTHNAIWTLGQLGSEKALPILQGYYKNDPKGETCYGKHDSMLCQYEIHKAIVAIERGGPFYHKRLNR